MGNISSKMNNEEFAYVDEIDISNCKEVVNNNDYDEEFANEEVDADVNKYDFSTDDIDFIKPKQEVLSPQETWNQMKYVVVNVKENFKDIPSLIICALLIYVKWDSEKLMRRLREDRDNLFRATRMDNPYSTQQDPRKPTEDGSKECEICYVSVPYISELKCGHQFCEGCWREYLRIKIMVEHRGPGITCAGHNCNVVVDEKIFSLVAPNVNLELHYLVINSFVECSQFLSWCPDPSCFYVIKVEQSKCCAVGCYCGRTFCFACKEIWHDPIDCALFKKWLKKCTDDSETSRWINANTKQCPKCKTPIEKDGGCNHMRCQETFCRYDFCWICLQKFEKTHSYVCKRYVEDQSKRESRKLLVRYLSYHRHFMRQYQSLKEEEKEFPLTTYRASIVKESVNIERVISQVPQTFVALRRCREALMATYVFLYYLKTGNSHSKQIEDNVLNLEKVTDDFSEYLKRENTCDGLEEWTANALNKFIYCKIRRYVLLQHIHEGYENSWWQFAE